MTLAVVALQLVVCTLALPMFLLNLLGLWNWVCKKSFAYCMQWFTVIYNEYMASRKQKHFSNLQEFASQ